MRHRARGSTFYDIHMMKGPTHMPESDAQRAWNERLAASAAAAAKEAERRDEYQRLWEQPRQQDLAQFHERHSGRQPTPEEMKAAQAEYNAQAPARRQAAAERQAFLRHLVGLLSAASGEVGRLEAKAKLDCLSDAEVEEFITAHSRAVALRYLVNAVGRQQEQQAAMSPFVAPRALGRV
jgi:hypothetical protein